MADNICSIDGCDAAHYALGLCEKHYARQRRHGDPNIVHAYSRPDDSVERFWQNVEISDGCWIWRGAPDAHGYGRLRVRGVTVKAHRFSYAIHKGEIPPDTCVCHLCDTPLCVNPDHLWLGSNADNIQDRTAKGRSARGSSNGNAAALTDDDIRRVRLSDLPVKELADALNVHWSTIYGIRQRKTWKHLD